MAVCRGQLKLIRFGGGILEGGILLPKDLLKVDG